MAARTMNAALFCCIATLATMSAQNSQSAGLDHPRLMATLDKSATIELPPATKGMEETDAPPTLKPEAPAPRGNPLWAIPVRAMTETRDRPLFSASRRPPTPVIPEAPDPAPRSMPVAVKPAEPEQPPVILVGTIVSADTRKSPF